MSESQLVMLSTEVIQDHPSNPAVKTGMFRQDVIDAIAEEMQTTKAYPQEHAIRVRPLYEGYQIVAGHHRIRAARQAGIADVWAWVRDMTDAEALMALALDNNHGEWTWLHYGLHARDVVEKGGGGRGKKSGFSEYARQIGRSKSQVSEWLAAAEVLETVRTYEQFSDRFSHVLAISRAPSAAHAPLLDLLEAKPITVAELQGITNAIGRIEDEVPKQWRDVFLPTTDLIQAVIKGKSVGSFASLAGQAAIVYEKALQLDQEHADQFEQWLRDNAGGDAWTMAKIETRHQAIEAELAERERVKPMVEVADAVEWLTRQEPCDLLLTDPPYSTGVKDIEAFVNEWLPLALSKVKPTGRAYVFIGGYWREMAAYANADKVKMTLDDHPLIWTYRNMIGPKPSMEYIGNYQPIMHFYGPDAAPLNCPEITEQLCVQEFIHPADGRRGERLHSWQKPMDLAKQLIRHATNQGDTILDPFCCTGTFLVAAAELGRKAFGCDNNAENLQIAIDRGCTNETV